MAPIDDSESSPVPVKKLSLKEVAQRFEAGDTDVLLDYRNLNLKESGDQLQQTLQSMPKGKTLMKELVKLTEVSRKEHLFSVRWVQMLHLLPACRRPTETAFASAGAPGPRCRTQQRGRRPDQGRPAGAAGAVEEL